MPRKPRRGRGSIGECRACKSSVRFAWWEAGGRWLRLELHPDAEQGTIAAVHRDGRLVAVKLDGERLEEHRAAGTYLYREHATACAAHVAAKWVDQQ